MKQTVLFNPVWVADLEDGTYRNPVLHADYADPDVIRVGHDFYMVSSSFSHLPGLPILHSRDLVNWRILSHVIDRLDLPGFDKPRHGEGVWAPSIRYHDGKFWVFFATPDEGIFMCTAENPRGPWTAPHMVREVKGWIDPCPFWDDDGRAYLAHAFAYSRCGIKHKLQLIEMTPDGRQLFGDGKIVFDGTERHPTMEGPKLYKRGGYYYIFAPAGGVAPGWQTILRSTSIWGPYEDKIVLHQGETDVNGPHQGGWIELESAESWFLHFQDRGAYGRIIHLQPIQWVNGWPMMGVGSNEDGIGEPVARWTKPNVGNSYPVQAPDTCDDFTEPKLRLQWQWQANPAPGWHSLSEQPGCLRLYAAPLLEGSNTLYDAPHLLLQKFPALHFAATAKIAFTPSMQSDRAGLMVFGIIYTYLTLKHTEAGFRLSLVQGVPEAVGRAELELWETHLDYFPESGLYMRVTVSGDAECQFSYSLDGDGYQTAGESVKASPGKWVGSKVGVFAASMNGSKSSGYADVYWFRIDETL